MIKLDDLHQFPDNPGRYTANNVKMDMLKFRGVLENVFQEHNIPAQLDVDCVVSGGLFNKTQDSCYVVTNRDRPYEYYKLCIRMIQRGSIVYVAVDYFGKSVQTYKQNQKDDLSRSNSFLERIAGSFVGTDEFSMAEEYAYYSAVLLSVEETMNRCW